jgi:hypothetical protein
VPDKRQPDGLSLIATGQLSNWSAKSKKMTPVKGKLFDKLFQQHEQRIFQEVGTKATGPRSIFANNLA